MISDVLSEAVAEIDRYLNDDTYGYDGSELHERIVRVRNEMDLLRILLDTPPAAHHGSETGP
jgi:hypothetical protein